MRKEQIQSIVPNDTEFLMSKYNVVLLTIDTLRADTLSCYGYPIATTPNLDRLAEESIRFTQAITGGSWTQAAFPVLLTSSQAAAYGGCTNQLAPGRPSPIEMLAKHGYTTAGFSTNPHLSRDTGYARGFHHFEDLIPDDADPMLCRVKGGQRLLRNPLIHQMFGAFGKRLLPARVYSSASEVTEKVCHWLDRATSPFFVWAHYMDVHWPYQKMQMMTHSQEIARTWQDMSVMRQRASFRRQEQITQRQRERFISLYEQSLQYLDIQIGHLLDYITASEHHADTIVIVASDHGEEFLEHGRWGHWESNLYDEILRVPLIIRLPGGGERRVIDRQVRLMDLMPTMLDLCGCLQSQKLEGMSLAPLWNGSSTGYSVVESISEAYRPPWHRIAVRTENFKYIWDNRRPEAPELYDLQNDPKETLNVSSQHPAEVARLHAHVQAHIEYIAGTKPAHDLPELKLDDQVLRRLQDLGYVA
jgi:arylsulfatase A-like enzyme